MRGLLQYLARLTIWLAVLAFPVMAFAGGLGIAVLGFAVGIAGCVTLAMNPSLRAELNPYGWAALLLAAMIWANVTASWSPYEASGWTNAHTILLLSAMLIFVPTAYHALKKREIYMLQHFFMASSLACVGWMLCDVLSGWGLSIFFDPPKGTERLGDRQNDALMNLGHGIFTYVQYSALLIGMFFAIFKRSLAWIAAIGLALILIAASRVNLLDIGPIALGVMALVMGAAYLKPKATVRASIIIFALSIIAAPLIGIASDLILKMDGLTLPESYEHRLRMWAYSWEQIKLHPISGNGFDAARTYQDTYVGQGGYDITIVSLHPHNIGLQIWLEIGMIGAVLLTAAGLALWPHAMRYVTSRPRAAALSGFLAGTAIIGATTPSVWEFWWWASFTLGLLILRLILSKKLTLA